MVKSVSTHAAEPVTRRRGRPRANQIEATSLGPDRIFKAALDLIDAHGLAAFNIRALADLLGVAPAAIYWHVPSRDSLVSGAVSLALRGVSDNLPPNTWQDTLRVLMKRFRDALRRHPHLAPAVAGEMASNAQFDPALLDNIVAALQAAHFKGRSLVDAFNVFIAAMCGFATLEISAAPAEGIQEWRGVCMERIEAIDVRQHPHLHGQRELLRDRAFLLRWSDGMEQPLDEGFEAWMDVIVAGLEARSLALQMGSLDRGGSAGSVESQGGNDLVDHG